jgi:hypothetical protein
LTTFYAITLLSLWLAELRIRSNRHLADVARILQRSSVLPRFWAVEYENRRGGRTGMKTLQLWKGIPLLLASVVISLATTNPARGQSLSAGDSIRRGSTSAASICEEPAAPSSLRDALRQVCQRKRSEIADSAVRKTIVIGFVGGFVKHDDAKHPEVQFAAYLRDRYPSKVYAEVFSNHDGQKALRQVSRLLDSDGDGDLTTREKEEARVIIYGHSWGAAETAAFARELGRKGIPVLLTIQVDIIAKPGQKGFTIPPNVANAVNFYQPRGLLHGRSEILAVDPARTKIIGNFRMTYEGHTINCDNYSWFARTFNKPHHEIENDPRVWYQAASLIDSELSSPKSTAQASSPSESSPFK